MERGNGGWGEGEFGGSLVFFGIVDIEIFKIICDDLFGGEDGLEVGEIGGV